MAPRSTSARTAPRPELFGRTADLERLDALVEQEKSLITLTGVAGVGKSALARAFAERQRGQPGGADSVFVCDLAEAGDVRSLCVSLARAIGAPLAERERGADPVKSVGRMLEARGPALIVLDNFEQLAAHASETVGAWLKQAPEAVLLVTSRERLRLAAETIHEVEPLELSEADRDPLASPAAQLFVARARRARSGYAPDAREAAAVAELVRELDGIPLAIELAAARSAALSAPDLLSRLGRRFELLRRGARDAAARHATLLAAIDSSWELLEPDERAVLAQCAVFRGGFSVEAAEAIVAAPELVDSSALDAIESLREKSLLRGADPEPRFAFYSSIRDYAERKLAELGARAGAEQRHARHFVAFAEERAARADGKRGIDARRELTLERDNLLAVIERAQARGSAETLEQALRVLVALDPVVGTYAPVTLHVELLDAALGHTAADAVPARVRALALESRGRQASLAIGRTESSERDLDASAALGRELADALVEARALISQGRLLAGEGRLDEAFATLERARELLLGTNDVALEGQLEYAVAYAERARGRHEPARRACEQALRLFRHAGNQHGELTTSIELALVHLERGETTSARQALQQASAHNQAIGDRIADGFLPFLMGGIEHAELRLEQAVEQYVRAARLSRVTGDRRSEAFATAHAGLARFQLGALRDAAWQLGEAVPLLREAGAPQYAALFSAIHGVAQASLGRLGEARELVASAEQELGRLGESPLASAAALCRAHLDQLEADRIEASDPQAAERLRSSARSAAAAARARTPPDTLRPDGGPSLADRSLHARYLAHLIEQTARGRAPRPSPPAPISVDAEGRFIELADGHRSDFERRHVARRLLLALVHARRDQPGRPLSADELMAAGWPGEKMLPEAAQNRLYVALSRLRELGLRGVLQAGAGGYWLDPDVELRLIGAPG